MFTNENINSKVYEFSISNQSLLLLDCSSETKDKRSILDWLFISPNSTFSVYWQALAIKMSVVSSWIYAFLGAFGIEEVNNLAHVDHFNFLFILLGLDVFFGLCILKNMLTGYEDQKNMKVVTDVKIIAINYLRGNGLIDILVWVPFQTVIFFVDEH